MSGNTQIGALSTPFSCDTFDDYIWIADGALEHNPEWRRGQAYFNTLAAFHPEVAEQFRGSLTDPFHNDSKLPAFLDAVREWFE